MNVEELRRAGVSGVVSLFLGVGSSFVAGVAVAMAFGYTDAVSLTTIGAGAVTYIVGPVTGAALGASSEVMALSIAAGLVKAILVMVLTPFVAPYIGLNNPRTAVISVVSWAPPAASPAASPPPTRSWCPTVA